MTHTQETQTEERAAGAETGEDLTLKDHCLPRGHVRESGPRPGYDTELKNAVLTAGAR